MGNGATLKKTQMTIGVSRDTIIGPLLFIVALLDMPSALHITTLLLSDMHSAAHSASFAGYAYGTDGSQTINNLEILHV